MELYGGVTHAGTNYRTPHDVQYIDELVAPERRVVRASPISSPGVDVLEYADAAGMIDATKRAVTLALQGSFRKQDIAIVTFAGRVRHAGRTCCSTRKASLLGRPSPETPL